MHAKVSNLLDGTRWRQKGRKLHQLDTHEFRRGGSTEEGN